MIRPLRKLHLAVLATIAPVVVVLYIVALGARPPAAVADLGDLLVTPPAQSAAQALAWSTSGVAGWWEATAAAATVELARDLVSPDMLLYCAAPSPGDELPPGAWMLGEIRPGERRRFSLPEACASGDELLLFSLGHRVVLARAPLPQDGGAP